MPKIMMDEMKKMRDELRVMLTEVQEACRVSIKIVDGEEPIEPLVERIRELEQRADDGMIRITENLADTVGKLYLAGLLKRAVICDAVVAHQAEAMLDLLQHVAENWLKIVEIDPTSISEEVKILIDSMLQNCIVMIEKALDILAGKDISEHTLKFIKEIDGNINQANLKAHESLLSDTKDRRSVTRMIRIVKAVENLGDKIKSVSSYLLYIRTGEFIKI